MRDFEKARIPKVSQLRNGKSFGLTNIVQKHCANSISHRCIMKTDGVCLLDRGMRCEYFESAVIPWLIRKDDGAFNSVKDRYAFGEKVPGISMRFQDDRICTTCNKEPLKKGKRTCPNCQKKNQKIAKRLQRERKLAGLSGLRTFSTLTQ